MNHPDAPPSPTAQNLASPAHAAGAPTASARHDATLVERFQAGDETAFVEIMARHRVKIFAAALSLLRNRADAEEITQDTFIRAHRSLAHFRGDSSLATWLYRIAVNLSRNRYWYFFRRRRHATQSLDSQLGTENNTTFAELIAADTPNPAQENTRSEFSELIETCMARLDPCHREILTLRNIQNLSYEEIGAALHLNVGTVKSRIARARHHLRAQLLAACPEFPATTDTAAWFEPHRTQSLLTVISA
jgi:RNA polymerase sigma-70 factor (ECF subfamily)